MKDVALFDVNLLVALSWSEHVHHKSASRWLQQRGRKKWATCPFTECGVVRVLANVRRTPGAGQIEDAVESLVRMRAYPGHEFWPDDFSPAEHPLLRKLKGYRQVTDAYLLMLAERHGGRLATFDSGLQTLAGESLNDPDRVLLIPAEAA